MENANQKATQESSIEKRADVLERRLISAEQEIGRLRERLDIIESMFEVEIEPVKSDE